MGATVTLRRPSPNQSLQLTRGFVSHLARSLQSRYNDLQPCSPRGATRLCIKGSRSVVSKSDRKTPTALILYFTPERWGELDRFRNFYSTTHRFDRRTTDRVRGISSHFHKAHTLHSLAVRLRPSLAQDNERLEAEGYSPATNARELNAVIETILCELYASLDCTAQLLRALYGNLPGVPSKSTRKLFANAVDGKIDGRFPETLLDAIVTAAPWVADLRHLRDTIAHSDTGSCHLDSESDVVRYMNSAMGPSNRAHVIDDIFSDVEQYFSSVNQLLGVIFRFLNSQLNDSETQQFCGVFFGRMYTRLVRPSEAIDFHAGRCQSHRWFDKEENSTCPFVDKCGAYQRKVPPEENA